MYIIYNIIIHRYIYYYYMDSDFQDRLFAFTYEIDPQNVGTHTHGKKLWQGSDVAWSWHTLGEIYQDVCGHNG